ncbi:MAG: tetratricopeptide repeat protein [Cyanobacteria bacterium NC_groundwater_1444_Ag_S-0.65um_54_12]|nr:tetratricopeptide repeat protein [Cyanobacteria bacterium NC_groundwater_1444_Ag_S-0.65um_54_12]
MMNCPGCGARVNAARFCPQCGTALLTTSKLAEQNSERRVVSVLFAEIVGMSSLYATINDPEEIKSVADACLQAITEPVYRYGGVIDKYIGEAIVMALFGAPLAHEDDPERALNAAFAMRQELERFTGKHQVALQLRVGINTGLVIAGAVGGEAKQDYTVMGDAVNLAQRLESNAPAGQIWVSAETAIRAWSAFAFTELPPLKVKGKTEPVRAFSVEYPRQIGETPRYLQLVGRTTELSRLQAHRVAAEKGSPQCVFLRSEAGLGKSALLSSLEWSGFRVWRARCRSYGAETPFGLAREILNQLTCNMDDSPCQQHDKVVLDWLKSGADNPGLEGLTPAQLCSRAADALADLVMADLPAAVILEDLQWVDDSSRLWIERLIDRFRSPQSARYPFFLAGTARPGSKLSDLAGTTFDFSTLMLGPLAEAETLALAAQLLEFPGSPDSWSLPTRQLVSRVIRRAGGNPRFLIELVDDLLQRGIFMKGNTQTPATRQSILKFLPATIQATIRARLDRLGAVARTVLAAAAVAGRTFEHDLLAALVGEATAEKGIAELVEAGILQWQGNQLAFRQELVREVAHDSLLVRNRRNMHQAVARYLLQTGGWVAIDTTDSGAGLTLPKAVIPLARSAGEEQARSVELTVEGPLLDLAPTVAFHLVAAEEWKSAVYFLWLASERAWVNCEYSAAERWLTLCLQATEKAPDAPGAPSIGKVWRRLGATLVLAGEDHAAREALNKAMTLAADKVEAAEVRLALADMAEREGDYDLANTELQTALASLPPGAHRVSSLLLNKMALIRFRNGDFDACARLLDDSLESSSEDPEIAGFVHSLRGLLFYRRGQLAEAIACHERALECRRAEGDLAGIAKSLSNLAVARMDAGDHIRSLQDNNEALAVAHRIGDRPLVSLILLNLGAGELARGQASRAAEHLTAALDLKLRLKDAVGAATCRITIGDALTQLGRISEGVELLTQGAAELESLGAREVLPEALTTLGRSLLAANRPAQSRATLLHALELAKEVGADGQEVEIMRLLDKITDHC